MDETTASQLYRDVDSTCDIDLRAKAETLECDYEDLADAVRRFLAIPAAQPGRAQSPEHWAAAHRIEHELRLMVTPIR